MGDTGFKAWGRPLEDAFFVQEDQILIQKLREMKKMEETKDALAQVSGIKNPQVLEKLVKLDVHPEIVASLAVVPLIEVAWADGDVDAKERERVLSLVEKQGIAKGGIEYQLIERWLMHRPEPKLLDAWTHYIEGLCEQMNEVEIAALREELLHNTHAVAKASGVLLGFIGSKVSKSEKAVLERLGQAFHQKRG